MTIAKDDAQAFISTAEIELVDAFSPAELDKLPFGAIRLDRDGNVHSFNAYEAKMTGRDPKRVTGKNFFTQVAPCTNVREFAGVFREGVSRGELHAIFPYRFDFEMAPRRVTVTLFYSKKTEAAWVFVREVKAADD